MTSEARRTIWLLSSNRWNSAITEYALSCAQALKKNSHKVVLSPLKETIAETRSRDYGLDTRSFSDFGLGAVIKFRLSLHEIKPDVILTFGGPETFLAKFFFGKTPKVFRIRGQAESEGKAKLFQMRAYSHCAGVIVPCQHVYDSTVAITRKPVHKVYLGCDTKVFQRIETMATYLKKRPEIVVLGRLDPIKGHERLMKIMRRVLDKWDDPQRKPRLHVIGQPANLSEVDIVKFATDAGLTIDDDLVVSARRVSPIAKYLSEAVLGVIPSTGSEVICREAEEFLLCGTPVVVSGAGSLDEVLFEGAGESYKNLEDDDAAEIVKKWVQVSMAEGEIEKRRRANRAKQLFSLEQMGKSLCQYLGLPL